MADPSSPDDLFVRTCQECNHRQVMRDPSLMTGDGWRDAKCRKCHSSSLDYGSYGFKRDDQGKLVKSP